MMFNHIDRILEVLVDVVVQGCLAQADTGKNNSYISLQRTRKWSILKVDLPLNMYIKKNVTLYETKMFIFIFQMAVDKSSILATHHLVCLNVSLT